MSVGFLRGGRGRGDAMAVMIVVRLAAVLPPSFLRKSSKSSRHVKQATWAGSWWAGGKWHGTGRQVWIRSLDGMGWDGMCRVGGMWLIRRVEYS